MKYGFAGNRDIAVNILNFLISKGFKPSFLLISRELIDSKHQNQLISDSGLGSENIYYIEDVNPVNIDNPLDSYKVDYIFGIHFPFIIKTPVLESPKIGFLNLHPAYLPYNKGWHTPSWAILDNNKYGATLHYMTEELDGGDIVAQKEVKVEPHYTANHLYQLVLEAEEELFKQVFPQLLTLKIPKEKQYSKGTSHNRKDLSKIQKINLDEKEYPINIINKIRALTTNSLEEAAYFEVNGKKYSVQINITPH